MFIIVFIIFDDYYVKGEEGTRKAKKKEINMSVSASANAATTATTATGLRLMP